ncbi:MAG: hypothetical protein IJ687_00845 [Bacteroidales bacterium]|nr:hypothetical protein [Bacteroidales bacterium]MBR1894538.1 hypothetical protein [Bacteroidales bacterium]
MSYLYRNNAKIINLYRNHKLSADVTLPDCILFADVHLPDHRLLPMPYCQIDFFADVAMPDRQKGIHPGHSAVLFANPFAVPFANPFADLPEK